MWVLKVKVITWPWPKVVYIQKFKPDFLRNYWAKPFKNLLLQNRPADFHETWYVALGTPAHHSVYKWWPWSDLDLFYGKVKFGNLGFSIGKSENSGFLETIEACDLKVGRYRQLIDFMKVCEYWRSRSILDLGPRSCTYKNSNRIFSETTKPFWTKFCMKAFRYKEMKIC